MNDAEQKPSDIVTFAENILGIKLTSEQTELLRQAADAMAEGKDLIVTRERAMGTTTVRKVVGEYLKRSLEPTPPAPLVDGELREEINELRRQNKNFGFQLEPGDKKLSDKEFVDAIMQLFDAHLQAAVRETKLGVINDYFEVALCEMGRFCSKHSTHDPAQFLENCQQQLNQGADHE